MPVVSIILPTYKDASYIIRSIKSVLSQSFSDWELIIVDDGLSSNANKSITDFINGNNKIVFISNPFNMGLQKTLNRGLQAAKGSYIARIDDDDVWLDRDKLKKQVNFMDCNSRCVLIGTGAVILDEKEQELFRYLFPASDSRIRKKILVKDCFVHSSVLFRRETAMLFGGYSESEDVKHIEDYDLWLKLGTKGELANLLIPATAITLCLHSISHTNKLVAFERAISLIQKFKNEYPNYNLAKISVYFRWLTYSLLVKFMTKDNYKKILKFYRKTFK